MRTGLKIAGLTVLVLAIILGFKAFITVFGIVVYYGSIALLIAIILYLYFSIKGRGKG